MKQIFTYFTIFFYVHSVHCLPGKSRFGPPTTLEKIKTCITNCVAKTNNDYPRHDYQYHKEHYDLHEKKMNESSKYSINKYLHGKRMDHHRNEIKKIERLEIGNSAAASIARPSYPNLGK